MSAADRLCSRLLAVLAADPATRMRRKGRQLLREAQAEREQAGRHVETAKAIERRAHGLFTAAKRLRAPPDG